MSSEKEKLYVIKKGDQQAVIPGNKVPLLDKIIWEANGLAAMWPWIILGYYLMFFYTDIVGFRPALAGAIMFGARMFDVVTDILIGWCVDNIHMKWGRYRSWIRLSIPVIAILWPLCFLSFDGANTLNLIIAIVGYGCYGAVGCTLYYIPQNCQLVVMTKDESERANMVAWKGVFNNLSSVGAVAMFGPMVAFFGGDNIAYFITACIVLIPYIGLIAADYWMSKKYELEADGSWKLELELKKDENGKKVSTAVQLKQLLQNRPAIIVVIGILIMNIIQAFRNAVVVYLFRNFFELPGMESITLTASTIAMVVGALAMTPMIKICRDTNRAYIASTLLCAASFTLFWFMCKTMTLAEAQESIQFGGLFWVFVLGGFFSGSYYNFCLVQLPMVADYGRWKYRRDQTGFIYSLNGATLTAGTALGGFILGICLDMIGYREGIDMTDHMKTNLIFIGVLLPSLVCVGHAIIQMFLGINDKQYKVMLAELAERDAAEKAELEAKNAAEAAPAPEAAPCECEAPCGCEAEEKKE